MKLWNRKGKQDQIKPSMLDKSSKPKDDIEPETERFLRYCIEHKVCLVPSNADNIRKAWQEFKKEERRF